MVDTQSGSRVSSVSVSAIQRDIEVFKALKDALESEHLGEWVLICDGQVVGFYKSFEAAADDAVGRFGNGPFLVRQIGAEPITLPASVMYRPRPHAC